jgi:hypothetical protein
MRRIAVLSSLAADDPETQARYAAFLQGLPGMGLDLRAGASFDVPRYGQGGLKGKKTSNFNI